MQIKLLTLGAVSAFALMCIPQTHAQTIVASDNFESYSSLGYGSNNTGGGLGALTYLSGNNGGVYLETGSPISGSKSMGIYSSNGTNPSTDTQTAYRSITNSPNVIGSYDVSAHFNVDNSKGFSGFNIKSGVGSLFGDNELVSFGLAPSGGNTSVLVTDASGTHTINLTNDLRGDTVNFHLTFDTSLATYTLAATETNGSHNGSFSGSLKDTNGGTAGTGNVVDLGFANLNSGNSQNLIVDNISVVPEPSSAALLMGSSILGSLYLMRRRRA